MIDHETIAPLELTVKVPVNPEPVPPVALIVPLTYPDPGLSICKDVIAPVAMSALSMVKDGTGSLAESMVSNDDSNRRSIALTANANTTNIEVPTIRPPIPTDAPISLFSSKLLYLSPRCYQCRECQQFTMWKMVF